MKSKNNLLEKLNDKILICSKCSLRKSCQQVVPGTGSAEAEIMFIGEAPGKKEDEIGIPFVGAAGKFLDEMLSTIKLKREAVYIANTVKCRPPENRDPSEKEKEICWPWLLEQIKNIQPKLIITLGRHSMERFLSNVKISEVHGTIIEKEIEKIGKQKIFILYHPAAALYNGSLRETLKKDFKKIPKMLKKLKNEG